MKRLQKILTITLLITVFSVAFVCRVNAATIFTQDGFYYSRATVSTADLYGRESTDPDLDIPKEFSGYYVTNIVDSAFYGDQNIVSLSFSKAILLERIGYYAFANCSNLSGTVIFSGRINTIGVSAFQNCSSLEGVRILSNSVKVISAQSFYNCNALSYVELPEKLTSIEKFAFANCYALSEIIIPDSVTYIDNTAFNGDENLTIYCYTDSYAHQYAVENEIPFILVDAPKLGDVNGDGSIDVYDALIVQKYSVDLVELNDEELARADVNHDNSVDVYDATLIQKHAVGKYIIK